MINNLVKSLVSGLVSGLVSKLTAITRTFIDLDPIANAYYEIASPITFTGDFEVEVEFSTTSTGSFAILVSDNDNVDNINVGVTGLMRLRFDDIIYEGTIIVNDGKLHKVNLTRESGSVSLFVDGVSDINFSSSVNSTINTIGRWNNFFFDGIIANAKFTDKSGASDIVTTFRLDNSPAAENYTYSTELLDNNTFPDNANARQYLVSSKGWIITDGGAA